MLWKQNQAAWGMGIETGMSEGTGVAVQAA